MNRNQQIFKPKPSDYHPHDAYKHEFVKYFFSASLVTFAFTNFQKVKRIIQFENLKTFVNSGDYVISEKKFEFMKQNDCLFNTLLDSILISISFENYFKTKLLLNDFVIHLFDKNKEPILHKNQKRKPIEKSELELDKSGKFSGLTDLTLNYNLLLSNEEYNKFYNLDKRIINYLTEINKKRNNLHFYMSETAKLSRAEIKNIENLKSIVEIDFAILQNAILDKLGGESLSRIKIN